MMMSWHDLVLENQKSWHVLVSCVLSHSRLTTSKISHAVYFYFRLVIAESNVFLEKKHKLIFLKNYKNSFVIRFFLILYLFQSTFCHHIRAHFLPKYFIEKPLTKINFQPVSKSTGKIKVSWKCVFFLSILI